MPYTTNPYAPNARRRAVDLVRLKGLKAAQVARMFGVHRSTIGKWLKSVPTDHRLVVETKLPIPKSHPNQLPQTTIDRCVTLRQQLKRCAPVIHEHLRKEGYPISLASVGRILQREKLVRKKKQATWDKALFPRPVVTAPGDLVQMDTIHFVRPDGSRFYIYALIDVYSRLAYAEYHPKFGQRISFTVLKHAQRLFGFRFTMIQTDHGPEFRDGFLFLVTKEHMSLRHSRIRRPNDNAHIERFNRTIQDECFRGLFPNEKTIQRQIARYIDYYNNDRLHLGLKLLTPAQFVAKVLS